MKPEAKALMESVAVKFGQIEVTSVCDGRHAKHSKHYRGEAFDFRPMTSGKTQAIVRYLKASDEVGGVGTYRNGLIHADVGERKLAWGGGGSFTKKTGRNSRYASLR